MPDTTRRRIPSQASGFWLIAAGITGLPNQTDVQESAGGATQSHEQQTPCR
jgi:hypothetical protein